MRSLRPWVTLFALLSSLACARQKMTENPPAVKLGIEGQWDGTCTTDTSVTKLSDYLKTSMALSKKGDLVVTTTGYYDDKCSDTKSLYVLTQTAELEFPELKQMTPNEKNELVLKWKPSEPKPVDVWSSQFTLLPLNNDIVDKYNLNKLCGLGTWRLDYAMPLTNRTCWGKTPFRATYFFTAMKRDFSDADTWIQIASTVPAQDGTSAKTRALAFNEKSMKYHLAPPP